MFSLFKPLRTKNEFEDWIKICFNLGQAALVAIPVVVVSENSYSFKMLSLTYLTLMAYVFWTAARKMRNYLDLTHKGEKND